MFMRIIVQNSARALKARRPVYLSSIARLSSLSGKNHETEELVDSVQANWSARVDLAAAYRGFEMLNFHEGVCSHLSLMAPARNGQGKVMLIVPHGLHWKEVTATSLIGMSDAAEVVEGEGEPEIAAASIHLGVHQTRPDATCVLHLHTPYATAIGCLKDTSFGMYHQNAGRFYEDFAYDRDYSGYALDVDEGTRTAMKLGAKRVLFMCNHGVLVVGPTVALAFDDAYYLERACMNQVLAMQTGHELMEVSKELCEDMKQWSMREREKYSIAHFESTKRILNKQEPNFAS